MAPSAKSPQVAYPEVSQRGNTRIFYWGGDHSAGELSIDYGKPAWRDDYDASIEKQLATRWRLGQNFWTSLDTNLELTAGTSVIAAGQYYLVVERKSDGRFVLILLDPVDVGADHLALRLELDGRVERGARLVIQFGKHELTGRFLMTPNG